LPLWKGFNLLQKFNLDQGYPFRESDFQLVSDWGFNFIRLPMSYRCWASAEDPLTMDKEQISHIDQAVEWGQKYGVHVNLNLHRAPGYCVNQPELEPNSLWVDDEARQAFAETWRAFAKRYRAIGNSSLSFDLLNEPPDMEEAPYVAAMSAAISAIREEDAGRLIVVDGMKYGQEPVWGLATAGVAQSTRGYLPMEVSHSQANWVPHIAEWPEPTWPMEIKGKTWNRDRLVAKSEGFLRLAGQGVGVHVGEWGCFNHTPHHVALAWMEELLMLWQEWGWGWALWNLHGSFGVLDSDREDVHYLETPHGLLDHAMVDLLGRY
jgi:endoglucanase